MPSHGQNLAQGLLDREIGQSRYYGYGQDVNRLKQQADLLSRLDFEAKPTTIPLPPATITTGLPLVAKFNRNPSFSNRQLLAVGGEEGVVTIASTENISALEQEAKDGSWRPRAHWSCHRNSIFDLAWAKSDSVLYTASGQQHVGVWDTDTATALAVGEGHGGSVKCISPLHLCEDVFASGARDGRIMLWDARCPGFSGQAAAACRRIHAGTDLDNAPVLSPVWVQHNAHTAHVATSGRASSKIAKPVAVTVTTVVFLPYSYLLASAGANDTVIKLWDLRMPGLPMCDFGLPRADATVGTGRAPEHKTRLTGAASVGIPHEVTDFTCPARASAVGVTHMTVSESGDRLLVSCLDSQHHLFALSHLTFGPLATWCTPPPAVRASFYMRSTFSPCGNYILSGSRDCGAHIWMADNPQRLPIVLPHEHEVTGVSWCGGDWSKVATCSDSGEVRLWTMNRLPAEKARAIEVATPAMASHVAELDADSIGNATSQQREHAKARGLSQAVHSALPTSRAVDDGHKKCDASKPIVRRTVQQRLNLQPKTAAVPAVAVAPAAANAAVVEAVQDQPERIVPLFTVMEAPSAERAAALTHTAALTKDVLLLPPRTSTKCLNDDSLPACKVATVHAAALSSPVSSAPVQPAVPTAPASVRRTMLPPVPIFSPAVNSWQEQPPRVELAGSVPEAAPPITTASSKDPVRSGSAAVSARPACGLEAAMMGLPQVRTESPARLFHWSGELGMDSEELACRGSQFGGSVGRQRPNMLGKPPLPPSLNPAEPLPIMPFLSSTGTFLSTRGRTISPRKTPTSFNRFHPRVGAFSPSRSPASGGPGPSTNAPGSCSHLGTLGTPTGSQRIASGQGYQAPQGVVDQILRNSPHYGSRASNGRGQATMSPIFHRVDDEEIEPDAGEAIVQRRLFASDEEPDAEPRRSETGAPADTDASNSGPSPHGPSPAIDSGAAIVAVVDSLLQHPGREESGGQDGALIMVPHSPRPTQSSALYDVQDGQDVGPALRYRAAHPDDMEPYVGFVHGAAVELNPIRSAPRFTPDAAEMRFSWEAFASVPDRRSGLIATTTADDGGEEELVDDFIGDLAPRPSENGFINHSDSHVSDNESDFDWDFDPHGDKENTPPSEPIPARGQTTSASTGGSAGGAPFASPSPRDGPVDDQPLPLPLLETFLTTPPRAGATTSVVPDAPAVGTLERHRTRLMTPFGEAYLFPTRAELTPRRAGFLRPEPALSLQSRPTASASMSRSSSDDTASTSCQSDSQPNDDDEVERTPSPHLEFVLGAGVFSRRLDSVGDHAGAEEPGNTKSPDCVPDYRDEIDANPGEGATRNEQMAQHHVDTLTPTKRSRWAYSSSDDHDSGCSDRSPSPTRRVRSFGVLAGPMPTPSRSKAGRAGAVPMVMPSPCIRGTRHGCASRLAPAPGAGYLVTAAATVGAGIGSESPMPKVGTASRTGWRCDAASEEYFRRRADDERQCGLVSPFGFGRFTGADALYSCGPITRTASRLASVKRDVAAVDSMPGTIGNVGMRTELGRGLSRLEFPEDDEIENVKQSVRSLSCVFETEMQGGSTLMVPCTYPVEADEAQEGGDLGQVEQRLRREMPSIENCSVASPALLLAAQRDNLEEIDGEKVGNFEPGGTASDHDGKEGRQRSSIYSTYTDRTWRQQQHNHFDSSAMQVPELASQLLLDESSRSFPINVGRDATLAVAGGGGLWTAHSGQGVGPPRQRQVAPSPVHSRISLVGPGLHAPLVLSPSSGSPWGGDPSQGRQPPAVPRGIPPLTTDPDGVAAGNQASTAVDECCAAADQQQLPPGLLRKHRQQTLQQCWGVGPQRHPTPVNIRPAGPPLGPPLPPSRILGPNGLMSPKYFR